MLTDRESRWPELSHTSISLTVFAGPEARGLGQLGDSERACQRTYLYNTVHK